MSVAGPAPLTRLEASSGYLFGTAPAPELPAAAGSPRSALEAAILEALQRPPCLVSFSGGRDSSAVLALAVELARREGLEPPIPLTRRYPAAPETEETDWQELLVSTLELTDWVRLSFTHELDAVGPVAARVLRRHGLLWPPNSHSLMPALEAASGGSLLTGIGGDQVFDPSPLTRLARVLALRERPHARDPARLALRLAPRRARIARIRRRMPAPVMCPWLLPSALAGISAAFYRDAVDEPVRRDAWIRRVWSLRPLQVGLAGFADLARAAGAHLVHPFLDPGFLSAYAGDARKRPAATRTEAMVALFGDVLSIDVCSRRTKASFETVFWNEHSRRLAADVESVDLPTDLVDPAALRAFWRDAPISRFRSLTLLQAVWLRRESRRQRDPQAVDDLVDGGPLGRPAELDAVQRR